MVEIPEKDRSPKARAARYREYLQLKVLPYRNKDQEGRYQWLKKQRVLDNKAALAEKEAP